MDTAVSSPASRTTQPGVRRRSLTVGAATIAVTVAGVLFAVLKSNNAHDNQVSTLPYVAAVAVVVGALIFAWLVPARVSRAGTGLPLAIISVPFIAVYWSGLSIIVGVGAILVALAYREGTGPKRGRALAAVIAGGIASLVTLVAIVVG
jgi:hypothetical protein